MLLVMTKQQGKETIRHLGLRLPASLHRDLSARAAQDRRSLNTMVVILLEKALKLKD